MRMMRIRGIHGIAPAGAVGCGGRGRTRGRGGTGGRWSLIGGGAQGERGTMRSDRIGMRVGIGG